MTPDLARAWRNHRGVMLALCVVLGVMGVFGVRLVVHTVYWSGQRELRVEGWMTLGMIARSYRLDPEALAEALDIPEDVRTRATLADIARDTGRPLDGLEAEVRDAIAEARGAASGQ